MGLIRFAPRCRVYLSGSIVLGFLIQAGSATPVSGLEVSGLEEMSSPETAAIAQVPDPTRQVPDPNRDRLIQPAPTPTPLPPSQTEPVLPTPPTPTPSPTPSPEPSPAPTTRIPITRIEVTGSTMLKPADWIPITQPLEGRSVTLEELRQVADAITQLYLDRGYITSRAILVDQTIKDGVVQIRVVEGSVQEIQVEGNRRVKDSYIRSRVGLGVRPPLNRDQLEDQLRLLKIDPLFTNVEASLRPGTQLGQSILVVRVVEAKSLSGLITVDNYSPPSVGSVRLGGALSYRNITGYGDEVSLSYFRTTAGGADILDFGYRLPVNPRNGTIQLRVSPNWNRIITPEFADLEIEGESQLYEISFRQPIIRNPRREFALSLGFTVQNGQTFLFQDIPFPFGIGPDEEGNSRTRVLKFGQDYVKRDPFGAWALRSQFSFGLGILDATLNDAPIPDGRFVSWLGQVQRVQRIGTNQLLILQGDVQLTPNSLLPSQQFVIGGGQSLRGFRQNARSGDNGFRISIEDRITFLRDEAGVPIAQLAPFIDFGKVWNVSDNPNPQPSQQFLAGAGLGFLWQPYPGLNIRLDYAFPFLRLRDRGNDVQDSGFYFSVGYQF
ncbi:MAG: ShlB/FhaC/HecB family hemolysin secretion/activation protein [Leptolyngbyaceae cyanobacterium RU_5_1]|nr:ShlB/FhaC/HecB family hemolysin secretion/activation protein [Leptolyngbyaceae cyanobacterium RU_5_1]